MNTFINISLFLLYLAYAGIEIDTSAPTSQNSFSCLLKQGYTAATIRGYTSYGNLDPNLISNIQNAYAAGIYPVNIYMFPCVPCGYASAQVYELYDAVASIVKGGSIIVWVQVTQYAWNQSQTKNQDFILSMLKTISKIGYIPGIFTSILDWNAIVGSSWTGAQNYPLWNIQHDGQPNDNGWQQFGGFPWVSLKQYTGTMNLCNTTVNLDYNSL